MASPEELDFPFPITQADAAGLAFREAYESNIRAGFTPPQSLYLVAAQITGNPGIAPGLDVGSPPTE